MWSSTVGGGPVRLPGRGGVGEIPWERLRSGASRLHASCAGFLSSQVHISLHRRLRNGDSSCAQGEEENTMDFSKESMSNTNVLALTRVFLLLWPPSLMYSVCSENIHLFTCFFMPWVFVKLYHVPFILSSLVAKMEMTLIIYLFILGSKEKDSKISKHISVVLHHNL